MHPTGVPTLKKLFKTWLWKDTDRLDKWFPTITLGTQGGSLSNLEVFPEKLILSTFYAKKFNMLPSSSIFPTATF